MKDPKEITHNGKRLYDILAAHTKWCGEDDGERADLRRADLRRADLIGANLRRADLYGANLYGADLSGVNLYGADLSGANLRRADLRRADLRRADLRRADLIGANLRRADLSGADLRRADLSGADLSGANLRRADLSGADLRRAAGNMREIKSLQIETWPVTYTAEILQIGCQRRAIDLWRRADPRWIAAMDSEAVEWWAKFGAIILQIIDASPAVPTAEIAEMGNE